MRVSFLRKIKGKVKLFSIIGLASLALVSAAIQKNSLKSQKLLALKNGIQTCFTRLHNTYTARLLGGASEYVTKEFTEKTEECLGEAVQTYERIGKTNNIIFDDLNALANDSSWFHQRVLSKAKEGLFEGHPENVVLSGIGARFEKLELRKIQINEGLSTLENALKERRDLMGLFFYMIAIFIPLFLGIDYIREKGEKEAYEEIIKESKRFAEGEQFSFQAMNSLIQKALGIMGLDQLRESFERSLFDRERESSVREQRGDSVGTPLLISSQKNIRKKQIDEIWTSLESSESQRKSDSLGGNLERSFSEEKLKEKIDLEDCVSSVIEIISAKIFTLGVNIDIRTEDTKVYGEFEALQQAIYHIFTNALENYDFDDPRKSLGLNVRVLGGTVFVDIYDSGRSFSSSFLRQSKIVSNGLLEHTDLSIAKTLVEEDCGGKISFENVSNEDGKQVGRKVRLILSAVVENKERKRRRKEKRRDRLPASLAF